MKQGTVVVIILALGLIGLVVWTRRKKTATQAGSASTLNGSASPGPPPGPDTPYKLPVNITVNSQPVGSSKWITVSGTVGAEQFTYGPTTLARGESVSNVIPSPIYQLFGAEIELLNPASALSLIGRAPILGRTKLRGTPWRDRPILDGNSVWTDL
jgi:hypothetical protein